MSQAVAEPDFILFAQHGWSDNGKDIGYLAKQLAPDNSLVVAPSLGLVRTYWRIKNLIEKVETIAKSTINQYPQTPLRIMGHSMGGLIWLEVLHRNPQWWQKVHSLVVIGSPIGGAHLARIIDPFGLGIGIARDLGQNRRSLATEIAQKIPTLSIAGELGKGTDGMVTLEATKFDYAQTVIVDNVPHANLKLHLGLIPIIQDFWGNPKIQQTPTNSISHQVIQTLRQIPGITDADYEFLEVAQTILKLPEGIIIRTFTNQLGVEHIFVNNEQNQVLYGGYVGWLHKKQLKQALKQISSIIPEEKL